MKYLPLLAIIFLSACRPHADRTQTLTDIIQDTVVISKPIVVHDTIIPKQCDSIYNEYVLAKMRLQTIQHYVNICNHNPKQDKFLRGWLNRALE